MKLKAENTALLFIEILDQLVFELEMRQKIKKKFHWSQ